MRWTPLLFLLACNQVEPQSIYAPHSLLPGSVRTDEEFEGSRRDWQGELEVEGGGSSWTLSATVEGSGRIDFDIRTTTGADLTVLHKVANGGISLYREGLSGDLSLGVGDDDGLLYLQETVAVSPVSDLFLGDGFVRNATDLGTVNINDTTLTLHSVFLQTDDGLVEAWPGYPIQIDLLGNLYRFVLIANWVRDIPPEANLACDFNELLAYEVVRIERGTPVDTTPLVRPSTSDIDYGVCLPAGFTF